MTLPAFFKTQKFYSLAASVFNSAIALVTFILLIRAINKEEFGTWAFFMVFYSTYDMALNGLIRVPVVRMAANDADYRYQEVISSAWDILLKSAVICISLFLLGFAIYYYAFNGIENLQFTWWFSLAVIFSTPRIIATWFASAQMRFQRILVIRFLGIMVFLSGVLYIFLFGGNLEMVFWFYLLSETAASFMVVALDWCGLKFIRKPKTYRQEILRFGKFSMGSTLSAASMGRSDSFIIMYFLGPEFLALYEIPQRIRGFYRIPLDAILQLSYPYLSKKLGKVNKPGFRTEFERVSGFAFLALMPLAIVIFVFADLLVKLLAGSDYQDAVILLQIISINLMISPLDRFSGMILDVINRPEINLRKILIMLTVNITGNLVAIFLGYGLIGIVVVTTCTVLIGMTYSYYMHRVEIPLRPVKLVREGIFQSKVILKDFF